MTPSVAALLLLALGGAQDSDRLVDDLIARTNGLKSFVANYRIHGRSIDADHKAYEGHMRRGDRGPEELPVEATSEDGRMRAPIAGGRMSMLLEKGRRPSQH